MAVDVHAAATHSVRSVTARLSRTLCYLYFARAAVAVVWLISLSLALGSNTTPPFGPAIWTLFIAYPVIDAVATLADIRKTPAQSQTLFQRLNLAVSAIAVVAVAAALRTSNFSITIEVVGGWAIASGLLCEDPRAMRCRATTLFGNASDQAQQFGRVRLRTSGMRSGDAHRRHIKTQS